MTALPQYNAISADDQPEQAGNFRSVGEVINDLLLDTITALSAIKDMEEPQAAVLTDRMVMSWHAIGKQERLDLSREVAEALTNPQRAYLFLACFRAMNAEWRQTVVNGMQAELLAAANAEGKEVENV
jgi:hypothetical protein